MNRSEIIAVISLVIGLPGFFYLMVSPFCAVCILCLVIIVLVLYFFIYVPRLPSFTIIEIRQTVTINDYEGKKAHTKKDIKLQTNHSGITEYPFRGIGADGIIQNFSSPTHHIETAREAGYYTVVAKFNAPMKRGEITNVILEYDVLNTFVDEENFYTHEVGYPTKMACQEIHLPQERPCKSAFATTTQAHTKRNYPSQKFLGIKQ